MRENSSKQVPAWVLESVVQVSMTKMIWPSVCCQKVPNNQNNQLLNNVQF